ncbi:hypothetical protein DK37_07555 [Halomonas sp. SUBG004]|nr:hypothetical protein DK37_07555 [Halomonas sp. SUBG004]
MRCWAAFAQRISHLLFGDDVLARIGGDEFVLLLHHGVEEAFFEKLLASLRQPLLIEGQTIYLTASLGITRYPDDHVQGDVLLRHANQAMYRAKQRGRDTYHFFFSTLSRTVDCRCVTSSVSVSWMRFTMTNFACSINRRSICAARAVGVEALIAGSIPELGLLSPR